MKASELQFRKATWNLKSTASLNYGARAVKAKEEFLPFASSRHLALASQEPSRNPGHRGIDSRLAGFTS